MAMPGVRVVAAELADDEPPSALADGNGPARRREPETSTPDPAGALGAAR